MRKSIFKKCSENYVNWVIRLGKVRSAILGIFVLGIFAILIQSILNYVFFGTVVAGDIFRSILFGLLSAPFVLYFFNVIVEQLERSRLKLERSVYELNVMRAQDAYLSAKLKQNSVDKTQLMATISHELRTPLNGIIGLSRMLLEEDLSQKQREYLQTINVSAVSLGYIFSDIIDLEKIDSQRIELFRHPVEFTQIIHDISHFAQLLAAKKSIQFSLDYPDNLPEFIEVDNARLSQVLWNLISNAVKFTPPSGQISLKIYQTDAQHFKFVVKDSGIGIPLAEQDKIFQMFYQAENSKAKKAQGSGIGLAISKQIALLMNGDLNVESEPNQGATFTFSFEAKQGKAKQTLQIKHYGLKVLLVEDVELNVVVARSMLEKFGCEIEVAMTGEQAQQKFEQHSFDLILLDIQLPDTTGTQLAQQWRAQYDEGEIDYLPLLVALTANMMQTKSEYQQQGMDDVLRKPLSLECLAQCLALHFGEDSPTSDSQNEVEIRPLVEKDMIADGRLNGALIQELCSVLGEEGLQKSIVLFESLAPSYILSLKQAYQDWQGRPDEIHRKLLTEQAHKLKGAFASIGLLRLQQLAELAQTDNGGDWEAGIADWLAEIDQHWQSDLALLKSKFDG
ncbi:ATP-binding protein [Haemophilus sputorum]|uniref:ATP-binding protein n=1 Tax=Haemophilus sputorum TaxID=1078480 RepID=UPI00352CD360